MKVYPSPHEKLTEEEIKNIIIDLEHIHNNMSMQMKTYMELFEENISKLNHHFFPERFSIAKVTVGELSEIMEKAYGSFSLASETRRMTRQLSEQ